MKLGVKVKEQGIYNMLIDQVDKIDRHNRQCSYKTRERYKEAMKRFCTFLADEYRLFKITNIKDKHIEGYITYMKSEGKSPATIKTELSAIRFYHDKSGAKHILKDNSSYDLDRRSYLDVDRSWSVEEFTTLQKVCRQQGEQRVKEMTIIAKELGLRIHEVARLDHAMLNNALKTGELTIKGKGGKIRQVPITLEIEKLFQEKMQQVNRGSKIFVSQHEKTHEVIEEVQHFLIQTRAKWQADCSMVNKTFHGLRHTYASMEYEKLRDEGYTEHKARREVSKLIGHNRTEVTKIYTPNKGGNKR